MFKKSILAIATVAAMGAGAAQAASVAATGITYSAEGSVAATSYATPVIAVTLGAAYQAGDKITLTFNSDLLVPATGYVAPNVDITGLTGDNSMSLGFLSNTANSVTYRVTDVSGTTTGAVLTFGAFALEDSSVEAAGKVAVVYSAQTAAGDVIDAAAANTKKRHRCCS